MKTIQEGKVVNEYNEIKGIIQPKKIKLCHYLLHDFEEQDIC